MKDYLEEANRYENVMGDEIYDVLEEKTLQNLSNIKNIELRGKQIGEFLAKHFSDSQIDDLCDAIKEGYFSTSEQFEYDKKEEERLNELFYNEINNSE